MSFGKGLNIQIHYTEKTVLFNVTETLWEMSEHL